MGAADPAARMGTRCSPRTTTWTSAASLHVPEKSRARTLRRWLPGSEGVQRAARTREVVRTAFDTLSITVSSMENSMVPTPAGESAWATMSTGPRASTLPPSGAWSTIVGGAPDMEAEARLHALRAARLMRKQSQSLRRPCDETAPMATELTTPRGGRVRFGRCSGFDWPECAIRRRGGVFLRLASRASVRDASTHLPFYRIIRLLRPRRAVCSRAGHLRRGPTASPGGGRG